MNLFNIRIQRGFTLIEMIITIVIFSVAMVILSRFLFPQIVLSAQPHYQARAAALANAMMSEILARKFDQRLIAQTLSFKEGIATIIRLRMTLYTVEAPSFMEGRMSTNSDDNGE